MKKPDTNLSQNLELSIHGDQFLNNLRSEYTLSMLMHKTVDRITKEFNFIIHTEFIKPDYALAVELLHELVEYGFTKEALVLMETLTGVLVEINTPLLPWLRMQYKSLDMVVPESISMQSPSMWKGEKIFIEAHTTPRNGIIDFHFTRYADRNDEGANWYDGSVLVEDLIDFALSGEMTIGVVDTSDHTGCHVQHEYRMPAEAYVREFTEAIIMDYVTAGKKIVIL